MNKTKKFKYRGQETTLQSTLYQHYKRIQFNAVYCHKRENINGEKI